MYKALLVNLPRSVKRLILVTLDTGILIFAVWAAFFLRFEHIWPLWLQQRVLLFPLAVVISLPVFYGLGFYHSVIRFLQGRAFVAIAQGATISLLLIIAVWVFGQGPTMPRSVWVNFWFVTFVLISGSRLAARALLHNRNARISMGKHVAIYGAGEAGIQLAQALQHSREFRPMLFLDDRRELQGGEILGLKVFPPEQLATVIPDFRMTTVLLAMPSVSRGRRREIIKSLEPLHVHVMVVPGLTELASGIKRVDDIRDVDVEDILGREPVKLDARLLSSCIRGKSVMVTGGGGSIGSELCRQIISQQPRRLIICEISEYALYRIEHELIRLVKATGHAVELVPILGSICHRDRMQSIMTAFSVQTVYHAAAYKHVPLVEQNPLAGVRNNIFGTHSAAMAALASGVETFVLVSTDKAVRPANVMGATKRFAELVLQALAQRKPATRFCMVRFGNVLASSGSVVPLFREQIRRGGPVTVTHEEMVRYFMTIPEAAQLVIQAGAKAQGGDLFLLNMGEPVRIVDLARHMIRLYGFEVRDADNPNGDIEVRFTGLRPGEKLYEELLIGENALPTDHPMILRAQEGVVSAERIDSLLRLFDTALEALDHAAVRRLLLESVQGYAPRNGIEDHVWLEQDKILAAETASSSVH
ncbi:MAG: polysaccharide biosynthesis protein [Gammaproteobacteria bacterium]|nr:polysaccharide biosynthesis protein [Gammaproteobacteria bacterium]